MLCREKVLKTLGELGAFVVNQNFSLPPSQEDPKYNSSRSGYRLTAKLKPPA